jgi:hypothetical protein
MGDYYCHGINVTRLINRNADLSNANIRLLEENTEFRKSIDLLQDQIADLLHAIRNVSTTSLKN